MHASLLAGGGEREGKARGAARLDVAPAHVGVRRLAEAPDARPRVGRHRRDRRIAGVQQGVAVRGQRLDELPLGAGDRLQRADALEVDRPDVEHDAGPGSRPLAEQRDLAAGVHPQLDHRSLAVGTQLEQAERYADLVVVVQLRGLHAVAPVEDGGRHQLRRRLSHVPRHAHDLGRRERLAPGRGQPLQRREPVVDHEDGRLARRDVGRYPLEQEAAGAARDGLGGEVVAVVVLARERDEEITGAREAGVDHRARERRVGPSPLQQRLAEGAGDEGGVQHRHCGHRAVTRGSVGTFRYSMISAAIVANTGAATTPPRLDSPLGWSILTRIVTRGAS